MVIGVCLSSQNFLIASRNPHQEPTNLQCKISAFAVCTFFDLRASAAGLLRSI